MLVKRTMIIGINVASHAGFVVGGKVYSLIFSTESQLLAWWHQWIKQYHRMCPAILEKPSAYDD